MNNRVFRPIAYPDKAYEYVYFRIRRGTTEIMSWKQWDDKMQAVLKFYVAGIFLFFRILTMKSEIKNVCFNDFVVIVYRMYVDKTSTKFS